MDEEMAWQVLEARQRKAHAERSLCLGIPSTAVAAEELVAAEAHYADVILRASAEGSVGMERAGS